MWHVWWFGLLKLKTCRLCAVCEVCFSCQLLWSILAVSICKCLHSHSAHCLYLHEHVSVAYCSVCVSHSKEYQYSASVKSAQILSGQGMKIAMCIYKNFVVLFTLAHLRVAGGCRSKGPGFQSHLQQRFISLLGALSLTSKLSRSEGFPSHPSEGMLSRRYRGIP